MVPPMSKVIIFGEVLRRAPAPARRPRRRPGPNSMMFIGRSAAAASVVRPPFDCIISSGAGMPARIEPCAQRAQVGRDDRHDIGVDDRRGGALVLLDLRQHLGGDAERQVRRLALDDLLDRQLVRRIGERVDQADRDRFDALGEQRIDRALGVGRVERPLDVAPVRRSARRPRCADSARPAARGLVQAMS